MQRCFPCQSTLTRLEWQEEEKQPERHQGTCLQAQAHAKLQALHHPIQAAQPSGYQNGHHRPSLQPQFDSHPQLGFPQHSSLRPASNGTHMFPLGGAEHLGAEPGYSMHNGASPFPSISSPPYPPNGAHPFPQNGASAYQRGGPQSFASPAPSPLQPLPLLSHRPTSLPPPRLNPTPPLKPAASDFGRGFGSNGVRQKRPHQDPEKVERTIFIENLPDAVDEQVHHSHWTSKSLYLDSMVQGDSPALVMAKARLHSQHLGLAGHC